MGLDIRTLTFVLGLLHVLPIAVFTYQYRTNRSISGLGFWLGWSLAEFGGFTCLALRGIAALERPAILGQNLLIGLGPVLLYFGLAHFLGRRPARTAVWSGFGLYAAALVYATFLHDDVGMRWVLVGLALAGYSFLSAGLLLAARRDAAGGSSGLLIGALLVHGTVFALRAGAVMGGFKVGDIFIPSFYNASGFLDGIVMAVLWTLGLILMVNRRLTDQVAESKARFETIFNTGPDASLISGMDDGRILEVSDGFTRLFGYTRREAVGRTGGELGMWTDPQDRARIMEILIDKGLEQHAEVLLRTRTGRTFTALISASAIRLGGRRCLISVLRDISDRKETEERVKALLREKELLLKEVHHRVKNNISAMVSMLSLQAGAAAIPETAAALRAARERLRGMARLYDRLYRSDGPAALSLAEYLPPLIDEIVAAYPKDVPVAVEKQIADILLPAKILAPLGIIVNELLTNALKHAFTGRPGGLITVTAEARSGRVYLTVADNGRGLPPNLPFPTPGGFGLQLVEALTSQIDGTLRTQRTAGARIALDFPY